MQEKLKEIVDAEVKKIDEEFNEFSECPYTPEETRLIVFENIVDSLKYIMSDVAYKQELSYNKSMPKNDYDKFLEERNAAQLLRDELCWLVGYMDARDDKVVRERLKKALKEHDENRCQSWLQELRYNQLCR